jgi:hypothetical protein
MPCTEEMIDNAIEKSQNVRLNSFTASPNNVKPGVAVTLNWSVANTAGVTLKLNGVTIPANGSKTVTPIADTQFKIIGECGCNVRKTLGSILVNVDEAACRQVVIPESIVRNLIIAEVNSQVTEHNVTSNNDLSKRTETVVEVDTTGILIKMRFKIAINNAPDPDLNIDMKIGAGVTPGNNISVFYKTFSTDVNWPWWFDAVTLGISKIIENVIEERIEKKLKPAILNGMRTKISQTAGAIPGVLTQINPVADAIQLTICN